MLLAGGGAASYFSQREETHHSASQSEELDDYQKVRKGLLTPETYINNLVAAMPEIREAIDGGWLQGVYYNPTGEERREIFVKQFDNLKVDWVDEQEKNNERESWIRGSDIDATKNAKEKSQYMTAFTSEFFRGHKEFSPILVWEFAFESNKIKYEEDFKNIIRHELVHAKDNWQGIYAGEEKIPIKWNNSDKYFFDNIKESRAVACEIDYVIKHPEKKFSETTIERALENLIRYQEKMSKPKNEREKFLRGMQLKSLPFSYSLENQKIIVKHINGRVLEIPDTKLGGIHSDK